MNVRAKFVCTSKTQRKNWSPEPRYLYEYEFQPVTGSSEENKLFFASTPGGQLKMTAVREDLFNPGEEYYLDFIPASETEPVH